MSNSKFSYKSVALMMSLFSVFVFIIILLLTTVKSDGNEEKITTATLLNFKEFFAKMIKEQRLKMQTLLSKIQTNAQTMLNQMEAIKNKTKFNTKADSTKGSYQIEAPEAQKLSLESVDLTKDITAPRSFSSHYTTGSGYGSSGNGGSNNYGGGVSATYHHHSIGFNPLNIVVSVSLLSFLFQAIQGLLTRTRLPTPVTEARNLDRVRNLFEKYAEIKPLKLRKHYSKKKYPKKYSW